MGVFRMVFRRWWLAGGCGLLMAVLAACSSSPEFVAGGQDRDGNAIEYRYLDQRTVEVKYLGNVYQLAPGTQRPAPFAYLFAKNGSCELLFGSFQLRIDSPYQDSSGTAQAAEAH